jgi:hypothetical protein
MLIYCLTAYTLSFSTTSQKICVVAKLRGLHGPRSVHLLEEGDGLEKDKTCWSFLASIEALLVLVCLNNTKMHEEAAKVLGFYISKVLLSSMQASVYRLQ